MIPWVGGKQSLYKLILDRLPADYRERKYVEVFGGGGSVLLNKEPSVREVYNDFNSSLVNLFRVVREHPLELQERLRYVLSSREDHDELRRRMAMGHDSDPVKWAADFYVLIRLSYGGGGTSFGCRPKSMWAAYPIIDAACARLQNVLIEHMDFERLIKTQDSAETIFYVDPPYVMTEDYYGNLFGSSDHMRVADTLFSTKGLWLMSYNDCDTIRALYSVPGIYIEKVGRINNMAQRYEAGAVYQELFISNYDTSKVQFEQTTLSGFVPEERNYIWK